MRDTQPSTIRLHVNDNVIVARDDISQGSNVAGETVSAGQMIPAGHKIATQSIAKDEPVRKYDQIIGFASAQIDPGDHVHT
ncbi:MAG: UxaA family hydrolase, partial [Rhodospirillaceae bacterium]|nr:UxaA family hydrolase [Rhodospirillaceae bacterium]